MVVGSIQIYSIGPQDFYLTGNPQITFFKSVFRRHTRFSSKTEYFPIIKKRGMALSYNEIIF